MKFAIKVKVWDTVSHCEVELTEVTDQMEYYKVTGGQLRLVLRNNAPFLKAHNRKKTPVWSLFKGTAPDLFVLHEVIGAVKKGVAKGG
jgi:hypothetical protein